MRLAVIGSRTFTNYTQMSISLASKGKLEKIVTGGSPGADQLAKKYGEENNIAVESFPGNKLAIVENCDAVIAFWDGKSTGTQDVLKLAKRMNKRLEIIFLEEKSYESPFGYIVL